jgi:plastocyanin
MSFLVRSIGIAAIAGAVASCGGGGGAITGTSGGPLTCTGGQFCMGSANFFPTSATASVGATVTWVNDSGVEHNVVFDNPAAAHAVGTGSSGDIGTISSGSQSRTFSTPAVYTFHCTIHPGMNGSLTVQ